MAVGPAELAGSSGGLRRLAQPIGEDFRHFREDVVSAGPAELVDARAVPALRLVVHDSQARLVRPLEALDERFPSEARAPHSVKALRWMFSPAATATGSVRWPRAFSARAVDSCSKPF